VLGFSQLVLAHSKQWIFRCARLGECFINPGRSCRDIYDDNKDSYGQSGYYWVETNRAHKIYCDMELSCGRVRGGWMRIAEVNTRQRDSCPDSWKKITPTTTMQGIW